MPVYNFMAIHHRSVEMIQSGPKRWTHRSIHRLIAILRAVPLAWLKIPSTLTFTHGPWVKSNKRQHVSVASLSLQKWKTNLICNIWFETWVNVSDVGMLESNHVFLWQWRECAAEWTTARGEHGRRRWQTSTGSGHLSVESPARVQASGSREARLLSEANLWWISPGKCHPGPYSTFHSQTACTPPNHTQTKLDTKSILQPVLFNNAQGRVEGCHFEKIGFHRTEWRTGSGCLQKHRHDLSSLWRTMTFAHSASLIIE